MKTTITHVDDLQIKVLQGLRDPRPNLIDVTDALQELADIARKGDNDARIAMGAAERFREQGIKDAQRAARHEETLRQIEQDAALLGAIIQWSESPQGDLVGSILKRCRKARTPDVGH